MKKAISVLLLLTLSLTLATAVFAADTCIVAGVPELCGSSWQMDDPNNAMSLNGSLYEKVYTNVPAGDYQFKVVYNGTWKGNGESNMMFSVKTPCDVTITYDPATDAITYSGSGIGKTTVTVSEIYVAGAKSDSAPGWLNGENWNEKAQSNKTAVIAEGVYGITYENIPAGTYEFKFAADQAWTHSWGGTFAEFGVPTDAAYNGDNISFTLEEEADVTLKLDLSNFDLSAGGARFTVALNEEPIDPPDDDPIDPPDDDPIDDPANPPAEQSYYVAGCEELCGEYWKENTPANKMIKGGDGIYTKVFENVPKGTYQLKVTDGTWNNSWGGDGPDGNFQFTSTADGKVTVKFDPATKTITVDAPKGEGEPAPTNPTTPADPLSQYRVVGSGAALGNWDPAFEKGRMKEIAPGTYQITFYALAAGDYEFKITAGSWDPSWGDNGGNYKLKLETKKDVTITFKLKDNSHEVTVKTQSPKTGDFDMFIFAAAALCATAAAAMLILNKKKLV